MKDILKLKKVKALRKSKKGGKKCVGMKMPKMKI
jgi:hypothetical protein